VLDGLREELDRLGFTAFDVVLPGEASNVAPLEGALRLREEPGGGFVLETFDYGTGYPLGRADSESAAREMLLGYLSRPLPEPRTVTQQELDGIVGAIAIHYFDLRDRARAAGERGIVIDLPADIPLDRLGALDGVHLYPVDTPFEFRSLPPHALRPESEAHRLLTTGPVRVGAVITPPWFGRPGGGIRFTLQQPGLGIRDLVVSGVLQRLRVTS